MTQCFRLHPNPNNTYRYPIFSTPGLTTTWLDAPLLRNVSLVLTCGEWFRA